MTTTSGDRRVTILDLEIQNVMSVENAFRTIGANVSVARTAAEILDADLLVLPGVGAFGAAVAKLEQTGASKWIRRHVLQMHRPLVGLCLGMQLLADSSEEYGVSQGLGLISGKVVRLQEDLPDFRVPNMGWREVKLTGRSSVLPEILSGRTYYHVHGYHLRCDDPSDVVGLSRFGDEEIASIVQKGSVFGTQFHPEKSQEAGLDLLHAILQSLH